MADPKGFLKYKRALPNARKPEERIKDYKEIYLPYAEEATNKQAARCMDCGVPFCHNGCPLGNNIPDFNDAVYKGDWAEAFDILDSTNNFPEFTGRICPAPCEQACVLNVNQDPVAIEHIEKSIIEKAFDLGLVKPKTPIKRTGRKVAIIGSGPSGLACADQLNAAGHWVTVFEKNDRVGGLVRYGVPDFKLEKWVIDRRVELLMQSGIEFKTNVWVGKDISTEDLDDEFDVIVLCGGAEQPRDLPIPGRDAKGIYPAMEFLMQSNKAIAGDKVADQILATDRKVVVIGGGDTGSDCIGTSNRQGASQIIQIEIMGKPSYTVDKTLTWPNWPMVIRTSSSHEEGCERAWSVLSKSFIKDDQGNLTGLKVVNIAWEMDENTGRNTMKEIAGTEEIIPCDLAF
ncbi:MAG: glutamate synthase subunit beta, partial [Bacteroidota bacterium]